MVLAKLPYTLPVKRLAADEAPIKTHNGGNLWQLPSGWSVFVAHTRGASALLDVAGKIRLRGAWMGCGRFTEDFSGVLVEFGDDTARRQSLLKRAGVETTVEKLGF